MSEFDNKKTFFPLTDWTRMLLLDIVSISIDLLFWFRILLRSKQILGVISSKRAGIPTAHKAYQYNVFTTVDIINNKRAIKEAKDKNKTSDCIPTENRTDFARTFDP